MRFEAEHEFDAPLNVLEAALLDPNYPAFLATHHPLLDEVEPRDVARRGAEIVRSVRFAPKPAFDRLGPKKLDPHWFEFIDESTYDERTKRMAFAHVPVEERVRRRLRTEGEIGFSALGAGRTKRVTRVEIHVRDLPFMLRPFAGMAEQMLIREARRMIDAEAEVFARFLRERSARISAHA